MRLLLIAALAFALSGCAGTISRTGDVWAATYVVGNASMGAGPDCRRGDDCEGIRVDGGEVSETFATNILSPITGILRGLLAGLAGI